MVQSLSLTDAGSLVGGNIETIERASLLLVGRFLEGDAHLPIFPLGDDAAYPLGATSRLDRKDDGRPGRESSPRKRDLDIALAECQEKSPSKPRVTIAHDQIDEALSGGLGQPRGQTLDALDKLVRLGLGLSLKEVNQPVKVVVGIQGTRGHRSSVP
jgi:hypothetical protein